LIINLLEIRLLNVIIVWRLQRVIINQIQKFIKMIIFKIILPKLHYTSYNKAVIPRAPTII